MTVVAVGLQQLLVEVIEGGEGLGVEVVLKLSLLLRFHNKCCAPDGEEVALKIEECQIKAFSLLNNAET